MLVTEFFPGFPSFSWNFACAEVGATFDIIYDIHYWDEETAFRTMGLTESPKRPKRGAKKKASK